MGKISSSVRAKVMGIDVQHVGRDSGDAPLLEQRIAIFAQGNTGATYSLEPFEAVGPQDIIDRGMGYGSIADLCAYYGLWPSDGSGVNGPSVTVYPLADDGSGVAAAGEIEPTGSAAIKHNVRVWINRTILTDAISINASEAPATYLPKVKTALDAALRSPLTTGTIADGALPLTCKWKGATGNAIKLEIVDADDPTRPVKDTTITWAITQPTGGSTNPSLATALAKMGDVWETTLINTMNHDDVLALGALAEVNEAKWNQPFPKPFVALAANVATDHAAAAAVADARPTDRTNGYVNAPGSRSFPWVIAARAAAERASLAHENPPDDKTLALTGIDPGPTSTQWGFEKRDYAFKHGVSTVEVGDVVRLSDTITFYKPTGQDDYGYQYFVDIYRLQNSIFQYAARFKSDKWDGAPLVQNGQATPRNPRARTPDDAVSDLYSVTDFLAEWAIITDPKRAKKSAKAALRTSGKGLDWEIKIPLSSNSNVVAGTLKFSLGV